MYKKTVRVFLIKENAYSLFHHVCVCVCVRTVSATTPQKAIPSLSYFCHNQLVGRVYIEHLAAICRLKFLRIKSGVNQKHLDTHTQARSTRTHAYHVNLQDRLPEGRNFPHISLHFKMTALRDLSFALPLIQLSLCLFIFLRLAKQSVNCLSAHHLLTTSSCQLAVVVPSFMRSIPLSTLLPAATLIPHCTLPSQSP